MLVLLTTLQVRSKALASSLLRKSCYPFPSHGGFFNNSKVETLRILRPKRSNQRQARGLPSSVLHYLVWLKRLLPPVLGALVVGRSECLKHANEIPPELSGSWGRRFECIVESSIQCTAGMARPPFSYFFCIKSVKKCHWIRKLVIWLCRFPRVWCQGLQQGITDFTGKAKVHHRTWIIPKNRWI